MWNAFGQTDSLLDYFLTSVTSCDAYDVIVKTSDHPVHEQSTIFTEDQVSYLEYVSWPRQCVFDKGLLEL